MNDKKKKIAIALGYDSCRDAAPRILATGRGPIAEKIIALAEEAEIPIVSQPYLARILVNREPGEMIPAELYQAVAEILAYVYRLQNRL